MTEWNTLTVKVQIVDEADTLTWDKIVDGVHGAVKFSDAHVSIETKETFNG